MHLSYSSSGPLPQVQHPWLRGDGLFETLRVQKQIPLLLRRHLARLKRSASALKFEETDFARIENESTTMAQQWESGLGRMRITLFSNGEFLVTIEEFALSHSIPTKLGIAKEQIEAASPLVGHKSLSYGVNALLLRTASESGLSDLVIRNNRGEISESCIANIFALKGEDVLTPPLSSGCLPGIARELLLENGWAKESALTLDQLFQADALFLSSSLRGLVSAASLTENGRTKNFVANSRIQILAERFEEAIGLESHS